MRILTISDTRLAQLIDSAKTAMNNMDDSISLLTGEAAMILNELQLRREQDRFTRNAVLHAVWYNLKAQLGAGEHQAVLNKVIDALHNEDIDNWKPF